VSIILIDARKGVIEQTYRHFFINNLLRVKDHCGDQQNGFVDYSEEVFNKIKADFEALNAKSTFKEQNVSYIPLSALTGDNVVESLGGMPWYQGQTFWSIWKR
jgi:sulfate adenylyltransferase subunit 1